MSKEQVDIVLDAGLLPVWMRNPNLGLQDVLAARCVNRDSALAPIMASYGKNISFQRDYLGTKGLFLQVVQTGSLLRLLSPCELAVAMGFPSGLVLSQDLTEAFQMIGNCFTPIHAAQALARIALCFHYPFPVEEFPLSASATVHLLLQGALRPGCECECREGLVRFINARDPSSAGAASSDELGARPGVSGPSTEPAAFSQALGDPSPSCMSGGVAPNGSLGDTTENSWVGVTVLALPVLAPRRRATQDVSALAGLTYGLLFPPLSLSPLKMVLPLVSLETIWVTLAFTSLLMGFR